MIVELCFYGSRHPYISIFLSIDIYFCADMRYGLQCAMRVIESCVVLHNLDIRWGDILPRYMFEDVWEEPQLIVNNVIVNPNIAIQYNVPR